MLHIVEPNVQDIFLNLPNMGDVKHYQRAVDALHAYFAPKVDTTYARHKQSNSLQPDLDEHQNIVTMAKTQITTFGMKSSGSTPARVSVKRGPDTCGWRMRMGKCG